MVNDLVTWLRAQLTEDERRIAEHPDGEDDYGQYVGGLWAEVEQNYPCAPYLRISKTRALAEVEAKRRLLDLHQRVDARPDWLGRDHPNWPTEPACYGCGANFQEEYAVPNANDCPVARLLALPYADRDGYREEWRP